MRVWHLVLYEGPYKTLFILGLSHTYIHPFIYIYSHSHIYTFIYILLSHTKCFCSYTHFVFQHILVDYSHIYLHSSTHIYSLHSHMYFLTLTHTYICLTYTYICILSLICVSWPSSFGVSMTFSDTGSSSLNRKSLSNQETRARLAQLSPDLLSIVLTQYWLSQLHNDAFWSHSAFLASAVSFLGSK